MTITYNGKQVKATRMQVVTRQETPNTYILENGDSIILQTFLVEVFRLEGEVDPHGNPVYHTNWQVCPSVDANEEKR